MKAFEYRDLLVAVWWDPAPGFFTARAWEEFGRSTPPIQIQLPFYDRQFVRNVDQLDGLNAQELKYVGAKLFDALFQGDILRLYLHLREQARPAGSRLRIRLRLDPLIAGRLPWECLYDTRHNSFLLSSDETTLVRFVEEKHEPGPIPVRLPLRVLLATAGLSHSRHRKLRVIREAQAIRDALRPLETEGFVSLLEAGTVFESETVTRGRLAGLVARDVEVLHLITECRWDSDQAFVLLTDEQGADDPVTGQELAAILKDASPRLIVVSGGDKAGAAGPVLAQSLLALSPALLILRGASTEDLVLRFSQSFYRALAELKPVDAALADARSEVVTHFPLESGWLAPALFLSRKDARVFFNEARERVQQVYQLSEGRYRRRLRETLNRIWPKPERYATQLLRWVPRQEPLTSILHSADFLGKPRSARELADRFQRMLLIGELGSGKTMTLYRLFYDTAQPILSYGGKSPLPIYVSLPELPQRTNLVDFLAEGLDRELFLKDLEEGRFLFLMDALDGLSAQVTKRLCTSLNEFMRRYPMNRFVVSARRPIPFAFDISNWVELTAFTEWDAVDFLIGERAMRAEPAKLLYHQLFQNLGPKAGNPQVLTMARRLWREGVRMPKSLAGLFMAFYEVAGETLAPELREALLPNLALYMTREDRIAVTRQHLEDEARTGGANGLARGVEVERMTAAQAEELLTELAKTRLLRGPTAFSFPNIGLQEFLTAVALRSCTASEILSLIGPAQWSAIPDDGLPYNLGRGPFHGVLPFLSGLLKDSSELVDRLIPLDILLAAECYGQAEVRGKADGSLKAATLHAVGETDPLLNKVGCLSLEARGDAWAIGVLERLAADSSFSSRAQALEALGKLRSQRSVPLLQAAARERDPSVSRAALGALSRIKAS